jgi:hypothetical protein
MWAPSREGSAQFYRPRRIHRPLKVLILLLYVRLYRSLIFFYTKEFAIIECQKMAILRDPL